MLKEGDGFSLKLNRLTVLYRCIDKEMLLR